MFDHKLKLYIFIITGVFTTIHGTAPGELSKQMCKKYSKYVPGSYKCPFSSELELGNSYATKEEFPHMVMLAHFVNDAIVWDCSGSLISEDFVLIAGHCLKNERALPELVLVGVTDLNTTENLQKIKIKEYFHHPDFSPPISYNDIGLVKLETKVDINTFTRPACLFTEKDIKVDKTVNTGWGQESFEGDFNSNLQKVTLELFDEEKCNASYRKHKSKIPYGITYDSMICAGTKSIATYQTTTGGPLLIPHKDENGSFMCMFDIIGVASFGKRINYLPDFPDVYTRVSAFIPWIEEIVWK